MARQSRDKGRDGGRDTGRSGSPDRSSARDAGQRQLRVAEVLRHALSEVLMRGEMRDPDLQKVAITVGEVRISPDLRNATAFVLPLGGAKADAVVEALNRSAPYLRGRLGRAADLRFAPNLSFVLDRSYDEADRIGALLRSGPVAADLRHADDEEDD
ncbi:30S ribosome-binding factor RbfA [Zavarzinia sp. CC-PAN008]|uniref:30S ribosome-binding factor RbfA n=1 Tax=Zavarzinia sp. CC-PAN008 TaxID=3243332 RepID=UPI003F748A4A